MSKLLVFFLVSVICLGYSYLCFFRKDKLIWAVTNPINGNSYTEFLTLHALISLIIGAVSLIFLVSELLHGSA